MTSAEIELKGPDGQSHLCRIECDVTWPNGPVPDVHLRANSSVLGEYSVVQTDAFECLSRYREELEKEGFLALCLGARIDAFPSGMCRSMGNGFAAYITEMGKPAQSEPEGIFTPAPAETIATVEQQKERFEAWSRSLG